MEENIEQPIASVEKVSIKDLKSEHAQIDAEQTIKNAENNPIIGDLVKAINNLSDEDLDKAVAYINAKIEKLKNFNK